MVTAMRRLGSGLIGGLTDQAVVSFGNFALGVGLARILPVTEYGVYAVSMSYLLFLNSLHQAFIVYPLSVQAADASQARYRHLLNIAGILTPLCALLFLPVLGVALWTMGRLHLLPVLFLALVGWQMQEVLRRGLLARAAHGWAILLDGVRYLTPLAVIMFLGPRLSTAGIFLIVAVLSAMAALPLLPSISRTPDSLFGGLTNEITAHWRMAAPVLAANFLSAFTTQWFLWLFAWQRLPQNAAILVALTNIVAIASPVMLGAENILVPEIARNRARLTFEALIRLVGRNCLFCLSLVAPFFLLVALWPATALRLLYGPTTIYALHPEALEMLAGVYVCYLISYILGATLRGYRAGSATLRMQIYPALLGVTLGTWLTLRYGVDGAALASLLAGLVRVGTGLLEVLRLRGETLHRNAVPAFSNQVP
jgi:O-antigen/teichoic acid export membrane protein